MHENLVKTPLFASLALLAAIASPVVSAQSQTSITLHYGQQAPCVFNSTSSVSINGVTGQMEATGDFDPNSNCPSGSTGGATGPAALTLSETPLTINPNDTVNLPWNATADVCRYDGSVLPAAVTGWPTTGNACVGASACAVSHPFSATLVTPGTYKFKLTCISGASQGQAQTSVSKTATVTVQGVVPPVDQCIAPAGMTRILSGNVAKGSGASQTTTNYKHWETTFGFVVQSGSNFSWPGYAGNDAKYFFGNKQYAAFKFEVPTTFPYALDPGYAGGPYGAFNFSNTSAITSNVKYIISISKNCGDFTQSPNDPNSRCIKEITPGSPSSLYWAVRPSGNPSTFACDLQRGEPYFFNIMPAALANPGVSTCTGTGACKINIANTVWNVVPGQTYHELAPGDVPTD